MSDIINTFNDWQRKDIERLKAERKRQERQGLAVLSLLVILGIGMMCLLHYWKPFLPIGIVVTFIGGLNFGKLINHTLKN